MTQDLSEEDFIEIIQDLARLEPARCEYHIDDLAKKLKKPKKSIEACIRAERKKMVLEQRKLDAEAKKAEAAASQGDPNGIVLDQGSYNEIARMVQIDMTSGANQGHFIFTDGWFYEWGGGCQTGCDGMPKPMYWQLMSDTAMEDQFIEKYDGATYGCKQARLRLGGDQFEAIRKHVSRRMLTKDFFNIEHKVIGINFLDEFLVIQRDGSYQFYEEHQPNFRQRRVIPIEWKRVSREIPERSVLHQFLSLYHAGDPDRDQKIRFISQLAGVALAGIGASKQWIRHPLCVFLAVVFFMARTPIAGRARISNCCKQWLARTTGARSVRMILTNPTAPRG